MKSALTQKKRDALVETARNFRLKWEKRIAKDCLRREEISVKGRKGDGIDKKIYVVAQDTPWTSEFNRELQHTEIKILRALRSAQRPREAWLPTVVPNCTSARASVLHATSTKQITLEQADWFARRAGDKLPRKVEDLAFYKISRTGYRYVLYATSLDTGAKKYQATNWSVVQVPDDTEFTIDTGWNYLNRLLENCEKQPRHKLGRLIAENARGTVALYCKPR